MTGCLKGIRSFCLFNNSHAGQARVFEIRARVIIDACLALRSMKKSGSELFEKDGPSPPITNGSTLRPRNGLKLYGL